MRCFGISLRPESSRAGYLAVCGAGGAKSAVPCVSRSVGRAAGAAPLELARANCLCALLPSDRPSTYMWTYVH
jgi:hypothetical protein